MKIYSHIILSVMYGIHWKQTHNVGEDLEMVLTMRRFFIQTEILIGYNPPLSCTIFISTTPEGGVLMNIIQQGGGL